MELDRIDQVVTRDTTELWEVENHSDIPHSFHPHGVRFRVVEYAGGPPPPEVSGLQDTVLIPPHETMRAVTRFEDYADPSVPYMFHCHVLEHEDCGMMGQFVVVEPGHEPGSPPSHHTGRD
jgi:FtsP/CotA-like multicopper oxidase with cupredoxin domain